MLSKEERAEIINEILDGLEKLGYFKHKDKEAQKGVNDNERGEEHDDTGGG